MSSRNFLPSLLLALASIVTLPNSYAATDGGAWLSRIGGPFNSQIFSSGSIAPGETTFEYKGRLPFEGSYRFTENGTQISGTLTECTPSGARALNCTWTDKYGRGLLKVKFSEDFSAFEGYWNSENLQPAFRWSGTRR